MQKQKKKSLEAHIKANDYFGTLATVLSFIRRDVDRVLKSSKTLKRIEDDLEHLQDNFKIKK